MWHFVIESVKPPFTYTPYKRFTHFKIILKIFFNILTLKIMINQIYKKVNILYAYLRKFIELLPKLKKKRNFLELHESLKELY